MMGGQVLAYKEGLISTVCFFFSYFPAFSYFMFDPFQTVGVLVGCV